LWVIESRRVPPCLADDRQITVFSGPERRRRWRSEERLQILTETFSREPVSPRSRGAMMSQRRLIYTWRRKVREASAEPARADWPEPGFAEAVMIADEGADHPDLHPAMIMWPSAKDGMAR
jgi:transposase